VSKAATDARPVLEVRDVRRTFGGVVALDGVSFEVRQGEIVGLIGPNGSGKTTLVNVISGTLPPNAGQVLLFGEDVSGLPAFKIARRGLARTFQVVRPLTRMTVLENVAIGAMFGAGGKGRSAAKAMDVAHDMLSRVGLSLRADVLAEELGVPDRKRLDLARALASEPRVLLLDEVLAGLRVGELDDAIALIHQINSEGVAIVVIEHVLRVIVSLCDRVVVLDRGHKLVEGVPAEVMRDERVVQAYLGKRALSEVAENA
jgi:branched-chain amino acid transport system ATP-binding protein